MEKLKKLLKQVSPIIEQDKTIQEEKRKRGEKFNIFNTLKINNYDEVRLHSAFIAELLNADGNHGMGDIFLKQFIDQMKLSVSNDFKSSFAETERYIGRINKEKTEGGNIDIIIELDNNKSIIIENKIYAGDQKNQLLRYNNYGKDHYNNYELIYLTLYGKDASSESLGKGQEGEVKDTDYKRISYKVHIVNWLEKCQQLAYKHPLIRETISQYLSLIKQLTHQDMEMDKQNIRNLLNLNSNNPLNDKDNALDKLESIKKLIPQLENIVRDTYFECCEAWAKELSLEKCIKKIYSSNECIDYPRTSAVFERGDIKFSATIEFEYKTKSLYYGLSSHDTKNKKLDNTKEVVEAIISSFNLSSHNKIIIKDNNNAFYGHVDSIEPSEVMKQFKELIECIESSLNT